MKKSIVCLFLTFFSVYAFAQHTKKDLVGRWEGTDDANKTGILIFKDNGKVAMEIAGHLLSDLDYKVDFTKTPAYLDIVIKTLDGKQQMILKCLIQFIDNNTLKWEVFGDGNRLANFNQGSTDATIVLKRKKE